MWAYDFVFDARANGQQLKCLTEIDEFTREALAIDVAGRIGSTRVKEVLAKLIGVHGVRETCALTMARSSSAERSSNGWLQRRSRPR